MPRLQRWCFGCVLLFSTTLVLGENIKLARPKRQDMCRRNGWSGFTYFENGAYFRAQERGVGWSCRLGVDVFSVAARKRCRFWHIYPIFYHFQRLRNTVVSNVTCSNGEFLEVSYLPRIGRPCWNTRSRKGLESGWTGAYIWTYQLVMDHYWLHQNDLRNHSTEVTWNHLIRFSARFSKDAGQNSSFGWLQKGMNCLVTID